MKNCLLIFLFLNLESASAQLRNYSISHFFTQTLHGQNQKATFPASKRLISKATSPISENNKLYTVNAGQVLINEIFANPSHAVGLPTVEFVELWNTTPSAISLKNWQYSDAVSTYKFGNDSIKTNEYLILCPRADTAKFKPYGRVIGLSPWPTLNNTGDKLSLKNDQGILIDQVNYSDTWYKDAVKKQGGWSLERIDPQAVCSGDQNWTASIHPSGGTPGQQNSVYKTGTQTGSFQLLNARLTDSVTVFLSFNRFADSFSAANAANYTLNNGMGSPVKAIPVGPDFLQVNLKFDTPLSRGKTYKITLSQITDCAGSVISPLFNTAEFSLPEKIR
ncbi:MAG TPA: lamin tail domain-containing protein, partial [Daejeonella sp.]|nr:lamin tail domain-containing protein [Daejeonella sp.]